MTGKCAIWGTPADVRREANVDATRVDSPRAGGSYRISGPDRAAIRLAALDDQTKAKLTTLLIDLRQGGDEIPIVDWDLVEESMSRPALDRAARAGRLLRFISDAEKRSPGDVPRLSVVDPGVLAHSESWSDHPVHQYELWKHLESKGFIEGQQALGGSMTYSLTVAGEEHLKKLSDPLASRQVFVAMWFSDEMRDAYDRGIAPGIREAGFDPLRIDERLDVDKIDDAILAEIDKSRFVVADMTHGADGVRGSVYYEAGYARGLGRDVIYCCRKDCVDGLPFDTRQHRHIVWEAPEELRSELADSIRARVRRA